MRIDLGLQRVHLRVRRLPDGQKLFFVMPAVQLSPLFQGICHIVIIAGKRPDLVISLYLNPRLPHTLFHQLHRLADAADRTKLTVCENQLQGADQQNRKHEDQDAPHVLHIDTCLHGVQVQHKMQRPVRFFDLPAEQLCARRVDPGQILVQEALVLCV